jgi:hypothetical protein
MQKFMKGTSGTELWRLFLVYYRRPGRKAGDEYVKGTNRFEPGYRQRREQLEKMIQKRR